VQALDAWENFYIIVGSSGGALTGLTFVVVTLIAGAHVRTPGAGIGAYTTPTIVYFGVVLLVAAILSAPWQTVEPATILVGLCGGGGLAYTAIVIRRLKRVDTYDPVREDWLWYAICPSLAYTALVVAALLLPGDVAQALFVIGAVLLVLLFLGIRNAWDVVTYLALEFLPAQDEHANGHEGEGEGESKS